MRRPRWYPRVEPVVKQPAKPWRWLGWRCRNQPSNKFGRITEALWDGWHWEISVMWENQETDYDHKWSSSCFFLYNEIVTEDGKWVDHTNRKRNENYRYD